MAALAVTLAPIFYFLPALRNHLVLCVEDSLLQTTPFRVAAFQLIRSGHLPLWDPYILSGMPFLAAAQAGLLFPANWFYLFFSPPVATNLMVTSSYMIAGLGAYLFARSTRTSVAGAIVTSLIWQFGGVLVGQISHINLAQTAAMLPWVLWSLERYAASANRKWGVLLAAFIALQAFAGHPQTFVYSLLLIAAYAAAMGLADIANRRRYFLSLAYVAAGVLLSAVQIVPTLELLRNSVRRSASYDFFSSFSMPRRFLLTYLAPYVFGGGDGRLFRIPYLSQPYYVEYVGYAGVLAIMLTLIAVVIKRDARTKFWTIAAVVCLILALGRFAPLQIYRAVYYVPILNLFRAPARHLMEVNFAIAVLAGRGLTVVADSRQNKKTRRIIIAVSVFVLVLTCLIVTWLRPGDVMLGRDAPISFLRAPELFLPVLIAALSAWSLWLFARQRRGAGVFLVTLLAFDLILWGQSSGWWVVSTKSSDELWHTPEIVNLLRSRVPQEKTAYRILTTPHPFDPAIPSVPPSVSHAPAWRLWIQPDVYMLYGIHNAAGYDGFGVERYSNLAGGMKLWGELTDPDWTLGGQSREIDLLNVRYLISMREDSKNNVKAPTPVRGVGAFPTAVEEHAGFLFVPNDLTQTGVGENQLLHFTAPPVEIDRVALITSLSWAENVPNGTVVARLHFKAADGRKVEVNLRAGLDTADWAYDRPDVKARIKHKRAAVATSYQVRDAQYGYQGHTYVTSIALPEKIVLTGGEIALEPNAQAPDLLLRVFRLSVMNTAENKTYPLHPDWFRLENDAGGLRSTGTKSDRWTLIAQTGDVDVYENAQALPRAWMPSAAVVMNEDSMLQVIRTGRFPDGTIWDPLRTALVENETSIPTSSFGTDGQANITRYEPNRIDLSTVAKEDSILVLSENAYPGWRAYLDGRSTELLRVNYNLRGLRIPSGGHHVSVVYRPWSIMIGLVISTLSAIGLVVAGFPLGQYLIKRLEKPRQA